MFALAAQQLSGMTLVNAKDGLSKKAIFFLAAGPPRFSELLLQPLDFLSVRAAAGEEGRKDLPDP
jgi:hypothetical protein